MAHVLIIEDACLFASYVEDIANIAGATSVAIATTQRQAVDAAKTKMPDLIIADVGLEEGSGPRAVTEIINTCGAIPVIFVTGSPALCGSYSAAAIILTKPVTAEILLTAVASIIDHLPGTIAA